MCIRDRYSPVTGILRVKGLYVTGGESAYYWGILGEGIQQATCYFDILVADDPVPVAQAPAVHLEASSTAGQVVFADVTNLQYEIVPTDTHGAWSGTVFTAPVDGVYLLIAGIQTTAALGGTVRLKLNSVLVDYTDSNSPSIVNTYTRQWKLSKGDTVSFAYSLNATRGVSGVQGNRLSITRIGDA